MSSDVPAVPFRVDDASDALAVRLVARREKRLRAGIERALVDAVDSADVIDEEVHRGRHRLPFAACARQLDRRVADDERGIGHAALRRYDELLLRRAERVFQELDELGRAASMEERRDRAKALRADRLAMRGDVPVVPHRIFDARLAVAVRLIRRRMQRPRSGGHRLLVHRVGVFDVEVQLEPPRVSGVLDVAELDARVTDQNLRVHDLLGIVRTRVALFVPFLFLRSRLRCRRADEPASADTHLGRHAERDNRPRTERPVSSAPMGHRAGTR